MTMLLFLPARDDGYRWRRITDARVVAEGEGIPVTDEPVVVVAPAGALTLHWAVLPSRSPAQAIAAARILAAEASAGAPGELHVAIGDEGESERPIAVLEAGAMARWLTDLAAAGIDPQAVIPAPLLLPRPEHGFARGDLAGDMLVRGRATGFADEPGLAALITGGEEPAILSYEVVEAALAAAIAKPPLDLRQGVFARRRRPAIDWPLVRRLALLGLAILGVTLAIDLVRIGKYRFAADSLDARADALAQTSLPRGETVTDADRQLVERLSRVRGPGLGYSATSAAVYDAVRAVPGTALTSLDFQPSGELRLGIACEREALAADLKRAMEARGLSVRSGVFQASAGRVTGDFTVSAA